METFAIIQSIVSVLTLMFLAYQGYVMRQTILEQKNQLKVNSYFQIWTNHITNNHVPIISMSDELAKIFNELSPYYYENIKDAKKAHFADSIFDLYESIFLMDKEGILDKEVGRAWKESIPYELKNINLRNHWIKYHSPKYSDKKDNIYVKEFTEYVENIIELYENDKKN